MGIVFKASLERSLGGPLGRKEMLPLNNSLHKLIILYVWCNRVYIPKCTNLSVQQGSIGYKYDQ